MRSAPTCVVLATLLLAAAALALEPEDLYDLRTVGIDDLAPDGSRVICTVRGVDRASGGRTAETWLVDLADGRRRLLLGADDGAWGARWRPDGQAIAYVAEGEDGEHVWLMDPDGGGRRRISAEPRSWGDLAWSPDGTALAFIATARVGSYDGVPGQVVVAEELGYRHLGDGYREGRLGQLHVLEVDGGAVRRLVDAALDVRSVTWSPDARELCFAAKRREDLGVDLNTDLWIVGRDGTGLRQLTVNPGGDLAPVWLADGRLAYRRSTEPLWESAPHAVAVLDPARGGEEGLELRHADFDNFIWNLVPGGGDVFFTAFVRGAIDLHDPAGRNLTGGGHDFWDVRIAAGRAVLSGSAMTTPSALWVLELAEMGDGGTSTPNAGADLRLLLDPNDEWARRVRLFEPQPFTVETEGGPIDAWVVLPADLEPGQPPPAVLSIHGGPEWMYGGYFLPEFHVLPAHGYAVVFANPVGSTGYGFAFTAAIRGDWVGRPARDVLAVVDHAVRAGWADPDRLAVMGGSYGGHLTAALTTQTDRFAAAAIDRMTCDLASFWGTTDEKWFPEYEFLGRPWEERARGVYLVNSPYTFVDRVTTPTLVSHGLLDYRCLISQSESWFSALRSRGVAVRFLRFEDEGHGIHGAENLVRYQEELLRWFDRHVLDGEG
jgi:dipeptidyl aminopeptidase/acylaminoacyl peptidase